MNTRRSKLLAPNKAPVSAQIAVKPVSKARSKSSSKIKSKALAVPRPRKKITRPAENNSSETDESVENRYRLTGPDIEPEEVIDNNSEEESDSDTVMTPATEREILERRLRKLSVEEQLNEFKKKKKATSQHKAEQAHESIRIVPFGHSQLGTFNGLSDLDTFLSQFCNCVSYYHWTVEDQLFQLKNSLVEAAGFVVTEAGTTATLEEIVQLLKVRFGNEHQAERFRAEMRSRRRRTGEPLQSLYQDLCRLKLLAFGPSPETEFSKLYLRDIFLDALNDLKLRKLILMQEPHTIEEALRLACRFEAIDASGVIENIGESQLHRQKLHKVDVGEESENRKIKQQLAEMRNALDNVRQELANAKAVSHPPLGSTVLGVGLSSTEFPKDSRPLGTLDRNNSTGVRQQQVGSFSGGASGTYTDACHYCKGFGHWMRECPKRKSYRGDRSGHRGSYVHTGSGPMNTRFRTGASGEQSSRSQDQSGRYGENSGANVITETSPGRGVSEAYLEVRLYSKMIYALLDTGCENTVIGKRLLTNVELQPTTQKLFNASGNEMKLLGEVDLRLKVGHYWTIVRAVVTESINELILGLEWIKQNHSTWDFTSGRFEIDGQVRILKSKESKNSVRRLFVSKDINIPAHQQAHVWCNAPTEWLNEHRLWVVKPRAVNRDVIVASSMYSGEEVETAIRVLNLSEKSRKLRKGYCLAHAEVVELIPEKECKVDNEPLDYSCITPDRVKDTTSKNINRSSDNRRIDDSVRCNQVINEEPDCSHLDEIVKAIGITLSSEQKGEAIQFLKDNHDIFSKSAYDLGRTGLVKHTTDTGNSRPVKQQLRRQPIAYLLIIDENVKEMLRHDVIEPSTSPWASNVILVRKSDQTLRFCVDYRQVNALSTKDSYPLPRIDTCFDALGGAKFFSTLDLRQGYWQVEIDAESAGKTTFVTRKRTFKFKVLSFGLSNAPAIFQRLMDLVLAGLTWEVCLVLWTISLSCLILSKSI